MLSQIGLGGKFLAMVLHGVYNEVIHEKGTTIWAENLS